VQVCIPCIMRSTTAEILHAAIWHVVSMASVGIEDPWAIVADVCVLYNGCGLTATRTIFRWQLRLRP